MTEPTAADVQEELQEYLNSKNINALFIQVSEYPMIGHQYCCWWGVALQALMKRPCFACVTSRSWSDC